MGLVATWLSGIGLSNAVPTFQAAGIVTPDALAELDVAHFEALGISDPDDRRKLFYLVQRIKLAVRSNKKKPRPRNNDEDEENGTVEEQVESVISGTSVGGTELKTVSVDSEDSQYHDSIQSMQDTEEDEEDIDETKESREDHNHLMAHHDHMNDGRRRSQRLAAKQPITPTSPRRSKENRLTQNQPSSKSSKATTLSPTLRTPTGTSSAIPGFNGAASPKSSVLSDLADERTGEQLSYGKLSPRRANGRPGDTIHSNLSASDSFEAEAKACNGVSNINVTPRQTSSPDASLPKLSGSKLDSPSDSEENEFADRIAKSAPVSRMPAPRATRPQSRLPNPTSKTTRTGKQLSAIPSEKVAPMSPLVPLPPGKMEAEIQTQGAKGNVNKGRSRKSGRLRSQSRDSLDQLLESEESETSDADSDSERSQVDLPLSEDKRERENNGFPTSESELQQPKSGRSIAERRRSGGVGTHSIARPTGRRSLTQQPGSTGGKLKSSGGTNGAFVHGGGEAESWRSQVAYLREDHAAEHELFGTDADPDSTDYDMRIRVIVRKRPVSRSEQSLSGGIDVIHPLDYGEYGRILVYQPKTRVDLTKEIETVPFAFDNVFDDTSTNVQIYERSIRNLIGPFFAGQWASIFAYGQTGSGKTYTMMGSNMTGIIAGTATDDESNLGLYYLAALDIFEMAKLPQCSHLTVGVSLFEIYGGKLYDLLNARKQVKCLEDRNGTVCFPGLSEHPVSEPDQLMELIGEGAANRSTGTTSRNADSSRSHAVLQLTLRKTVGRKKNVEHGRLTFIDLAGSERGADTNSSSRATRLEGAEINTSLLALKEVIRALATGGSMTHIPFRGSKLTQVLKDSFVGKNSRCCMIACISPDIGNCDQTLNTLRYSDRVKERNPETGALSSKCEQPTKVPTLKIPSQSRMPSSVDVSGAVSTTSSVTASDCARQDESYVVTNDDESENADFVSDTDTDVLDDLLDASAHDRKFTKSTPGLTQSSKRLAGEILVSEHRSVMSAMLAMVKNEMTLVNKVDADRDGLDDYLAQLEVIQETQLKLIEKLRGALHDYVSAAEDDHVAGRDRSNSEESFEDLRD